MSLPTQEQFEDLVMSLMSGDNQRRKQAETYYNEIMQNPSWVCQAHIAVMKNSLKEDTRYMCTILLRRLLDPTSTTKTFVSLLPEQQQMIKADLVQLFTDNTLPRTVRKGVTGCIAAVVVSLSGTEGWDEVVPFLLDAVNNGSSDMRLACALVFKQVATCLVDKFMASGHVNNFCSAMVKCLQDPLHQVRVATVEALAQFIAVMSESDADKLRQLIPAVISTLQDCLNKGDHESASSILDPLVYISDNNVDFFGRYMSDVVNVMMSIATKDNILQSLRIYSVEFLLSFCERAPKIARGIPNFVRSFFELNLKLSSYPPETDDWAVSYEEDERGDGDDISNYDVGLEGLDRMACALKGKTLEPIATEFIVRNAQNSDWHIRQSALMCIGQIAEGCHDAFLKNISNIITLLLNKINDGHMRVRYACMASLAQIFTDFGSELEEEDVKRMVPAVIAMLRDDVPRIQAITAAAVCNFTETSDAEIIEQFANSLLENLVNLLHHTNHIFVKEQCLAAIGALAEGSYAGTFGQFYDRLMPILKPILDLGDAREVRHCKCRALEAITLMAVSVGKEQFRDARDVCKYLQHQQSLQRDADDPYIRYIIRGWACMAKCLKRDFSEYLQSALGPIMSILQQEVQMDILQDGDEGGDEEEEGTQIIQLCIKGVGDKKVKLHTALIEDKQMAMNMMLACIEETQDAILPFMDAIVTEVTKLLSFSFVDEVRESAAQAAALCVKVARQFSEANGGAHDQANVNLSLHFLKEILTVIKKEAETHVLSEQLTAIHITLENTPPNFMPPEALTEVSVVMKQVFEEGIKRRKELFAEIAGEDDEDVDGLMEEHEDEETLLVAAVDVIGRLLKTQEQFFPIFTQEFLPNFAELLHEDAGATEHKIALCVLDDFMDVRPELCLPYFPSIVEAMMKYMCNEHHEVMQAASFGCGLVADLMAKYPNVRNPQMAVTMAEKLVTNLNKDPEDEEAYYHAMANVASSLLKFLRSFGEELKKHEPTILRAIIRRLPMKMDETEARYVHRTLVELRKQNHPVLVAEENKVRNALRTVVDSELLDNETNAIVSAMKP